MHEWEKRMADNEVNQRKFNRLKDVLQECLAMAEHHRTKPYRNHICGPESTCDNRCMEAFYDSQLILRIKDAIKDCTNE